MTFLFILLASLTVSLISFIGAVFLVNTHLWKGAHATKLVSFAAGVMLAASFFDLLPEAHEAAGELSMYPYVLYGILVFFFLERFVLWFHHHHEGHGTKPAAILVLIGDSIHNLLDGIAITATFMISPALGITTTLAIAAHEIPQEIADFSVLVASGMKKSTALFFNFASGLTALLGAVLAYFFLETVQGIEWMILAFAAGMFLYISLSDLIPELHEEFSQKRRWAQTLPFLFGIVLLWVFVKVLEG